MTTGSYPGMLAAARRARRYSLAANVGATLETRPIDVQRTIDAAVAAACKVIAESGMPLYVADGADDIAALLYQRVIRGAESELAARRATAERDAADLAVILS